MKITPVRHAGDIGKWPTSWWCGPLRWALGLEVAGLVYEQVVFIPNYFAADALAAKGHFHAFHAFTNPAHFHAIPGLMVAIGLGAVWRATRHADDHRRAVSATLAALVAGLLTAVAVGWLNDLLFFGEPVASGESVRGLAAVWSAVNLGRIGLLSYALFQVDRLARRAVDAG